MTTPAVKKHHNHYWTVLHRELWRLNWLPPAQQSVEVAARSSFAANKLVFTSTLDLGESTLIDNRLVIMSKTSDRYSPTQVNIQDPRPI